MGCRTYHRYFKLEFVVNRATHVSLPSPIDPAKLVLQAKVFELRSKRGSYPAIAKFLNIGLGTMWNMFNQIGSND